MKFRTLLLLCITIVAGALYGRFSFLRDKGFVGRDTSFVDYVTGQSGTTPLPPEAPPAPKPPAPEAPPAKAPKEKAPPPVPASKKTDAKTPAPAAAPSLAQAQSAIKTGKYEEAIALLANANTPEARALRRDAQALFQIVRDVEADPGAYSTNVREVTLANGSSFYAVSAEKTADVWAFTLDKGGKSELEVAQVASVKKVDPAKFRAARREELLAYMKQLRGEGVFRAMKAMRVAWRRGFPDVAYAELTSMAATPKGFEALAAILPIEEPREVAIAPVENPSETAVAKKTPAKATTPTTPPPEVGPGTIAAKTPPTGRGAFATVDVQIQEAQKLIRSALNKEDKDADKAIRAAAKLLAACKDNMMHDSSLPRGPEYDARINKITLLLDDVIKLSGFGL